MTNNNLKQTDIFSLFGIEDEYAIEKQKEEEERQRMQAEMVKKLEERKKNVSSDTAKKKEEIFKVDNDTVIYFYSEKIDINDYFTTEELVNGIAKKNKDKEIKYTPISKNDIKNRLKKDLPVLEAGAELVYIEKKNMISVLLQAKKKGIITKESNLDSFANSKKKISFSILREFISISKFFSDQHGTEVHADIFYDFDSDSFFMDIPEQRAHKLWVEVTEDPYEAAMKVIGKHVMKCMEIHSHHVMPPIPSTQDDESERAPILYAIVGNIDDFFPSITVRTFNMGIEKHIKLDPWDIFDSPFSNVSSTYDLSVVEVVR